MAGGAYARVVNDRGEVEKAAQRVEHERGVVVQVAQAAVIAGDQRHNRGRQLSQAQHAREAVHQVRAGQQQQQQDCVIGHWVQAGRQKDGN